MFACTVVHHLDIVNDIFMSLLTGEIALVIRAFGFKLLEKRSSTTLPQQFPLRFMLQRISWAASRHW
jgi:hypothetical protein